MLIRRDMTPQKAQHRDRSPLASLSCVLLTRFIYSAPWSRSQAPQGKCSILSETKSLSDMQEKQSIVLTKCWQYRNKQLHTSLSLLLLLERVTLNRKKKQTLPCPSFVGCWILFHFSLITHMSAFLCVNFFPMISSFHLHWGFPEKNPMTSVCLNVPPDLHLTQFLFLSDVFYRYHRCVVFGVQKYFWKDLVYILGTPVVEPKETYSLYSIFFKFIWEAGR